MLNDYEPDIYTLTDEEGAEHVFELLDTLEQDGRRYFAMAPCPEPEQTEEPDENLFIILKSEIENGEEMMVSVDDDEEYARIGNLFIRRFEEEMFEED